MKFVNANCEEPNESCAKVMVYNDGDSDATEMHKCINTNYCDADVNIFVFGASEKKIEEVSCPDPDGEKVSQA